MPYSNKDFKRSSLGKWVEYESPYNPELLFAIPRKPKRDEIAVPEPLPFLGFDLWNHYEVSWLNEKGKPEAAVAEIRYDCTSPNIIESKSMKLYFNSLNQHNFKSAELVQRTVIQDLEAKVQAPVSVKITPIQDVDELSFRRSFQGTCLDALDIKCSVYSVEPSFLTTSGAIVSETLCSNLLKSNCLVTGQPDWASIQICYQGKAIDHAGLLRYLVSFRNHPEFHEQCVERIFMDILRYCQPQALTVYAHYTRRGGLDINPYRSTQPIKA